MKNVMNGKTDFEIREIIKKSDVRRKLVGPEHDPNTPYYNMAFNKDPKYI